MSKYLAALKGRDFQSPHTRPLSELPKAPYDSFGSTQVSALQKYRGIGELAVANNTRVTDHSDDRRHCTDCGNLTKREQRCLAAWRGDLEGAGRDYRPSLDLPRRCERYGPKQP